MYISTHSSTDWRMVTCHLLLYSRESIYIVMESTTTDQLHNINSRGWQEASQALPTRRSTRQWIRITASSLKAQHPTRWRWRPISDICQVIHFFWVRTAVLAITDWGRGDSPQLLSSWAECSRYICLLFLLLVWNGMKTLLCLSLVCSWAAIQQSNWGSGWDRNEMHNCIRRDLST